MALKAIRTVVAETITTFQMQQGTLPSTNQDLHRLPGQVQG